MKKTAASLLAGILALTLAGCGNNASSGTVYHVAIVKQMEHASLDEIANAITAELDRLAKENNVTIDYGDVYDGQNDQSQLTTIGSKITASGPDCIIPIATLAAQTMTVAAEEKQTPVIFAAISDPSAADLDGIPYVTGTSDALDTDQLLEMMLAENPDVKTVGLLYSKSEPNSEKPVEEAKKFLAGKGIECVEATGNTTDEIQSAVSTLIGRVDAVFTPTDNVVMAAELSIADELAEAGIPHYAGADSFVRSGAFASCGVNYTDLGTKTADLAYQVMTQGMDSLSDYQPDGMTKEGSYYVVSGTDVTVNTDTASKGGFAYDMFSDFGTVKETVTTEE